MVEKPLLTVNLLIWKSVFKFQELLKIVKAVLEVACLDLLLQRENNASIEHIHLILLQWFGTGYCWTDSYKKKNASENKT